MPRKCVPLEENVGTTEDFPVAWPDISDVHGLTGYKKPTFWLIFLACLKNFPASNIVPVYRCPRIVFPTDFCSYACTYTLKLEYLCVPIQNCFFVSHTLNA